jgi:hypothetical protein
MIHKYRLSCRPAQFLLGAALLLPLSAFSQVSHTRSTLDTVITLDHGGSPQSPNYVRAQGEYSFAHGPANFYAFSPARVGEPAPLEAVTLRFSGPTTLTKIESTNSDFKVEPGSSCAEGNSYSKGDSCIVLVRFTPQGPGRRLGRLTVSHTASAEPAAFGLGGNGYSPAISFVPAVVNTIAATYSAPNGVLKSAPNLAVDGGDILYIDDTGNNLLRKMDSSGVMVNVTPAFATAASIAVDSFGDVWAANTAGATYYFSNYDPTLEQSAWFTTYKSGSTCTQSAPCSLTTVGMESPAEVSIDSDNNLFMEEETKGALEMPVGAWAGGDETVDLWYLDDLYAYFLGPPSTFATSADDDLFTAVSYSLEEDCAIVEEPEYEAENGDPTLTRVAGGVSCGYSGDGGQAAGAEIGSTIGQIAFDTAGNLYFTDAANERVRMINVNSGIITTVVGSGTKGFTDASGGRSTSISLSSPTGVAVDSQGQIYVITEAPSGSATQVVQKVSTVGYLIFPGTTEGVTSAAQILTVNNVGNSTMVLDSYAFTGADPGDFSIDPTTTNCPLTAGSTLYTGATCKIGVKFKPAASGARSANLVLLDNTVNGSNSVELTGTGTAPAPSFVPGAVSFPATTPTLSNVVPVTVTNNGNVALDVKNITLSGANAGAFTVSGNCAGGSVAPGATCNLTVTFKPSSTGNYSAALNFTDNAPDSPQSVFVSGSGVKPYTSATKLTSATNPAPACSAVTFHVTVSTSDGSAASGPVSMQMGSLTLASGTLSKGTATLTVQGLAPGLNLLTANYGGDTEHNGSLSTTLSQMVDRGSCGSLRLPQPAHEMPLHDAPITDRP